MNAVKGAAAGEVTILDLDGRLVLDDGVDLLRERINALTAESRVRIVVNMKDVTYVDSCGVGILIAKYVSLRNRGGSVKLLHLTRRSHHVMEISKLLSIFEASIPKTTQSEFRLALHLRPLRQSSSFQGLDPGRGRHPSEGECGGAGSCIQARRRGACLSTSREYVRKVFSGRPALRQLTIHGQRVGGRNAPDADWDRLRAAQVALPGQRCDQRNRAKESFTHSTMVLSSASPERNFASSISRPDPDENGRCRPFPTPLPTGAASSCKSLRRLETADGKFAALVVAVVRGRFPSFRKRYAGQEGRSPCFTRRAPCCCVNLRPPG